MKLTAQQTKLLNIEFATKLDALLAGIRAKAVAQFAYNVETNVPADILDPAEVVEHAVLHGIVSAASAYNDYGIEPSIRLAAEILEDVNAHTEAAPLFAILKEGAK